MQCFGSRRRTIDRDTTDSGHDAHSQQGNGQIIAAWQSINQSIEQQGTERVALAENSINFMSWLSGEILVKAASAMNFIIELTLRCSCSL